jgi:hypothetical protein
MTVETTALARRSERCPDLDEDAIGQTVFTIIKEWFMDATSATAYAVSPLRVKSRSLMVLESYEVSPMSKSSFRSGSATAPTRPDWTSP